MMGDKEAFYALRYPEVRNALVRRAAANVNSRIQKAIRGEGGAMYTETHLSH